MKTLQLSALPPATSKKKSKIEYIIAVASYGDYRKIADNDLLEFLLTGTLVISDKGEISYDDKAKKICRHVKTNQIKNYVATDATKAYDGYVVATAENIPKLTKVLLDFYNHKDVKEKGYVMPFTLLRECQEFVPDANDKATEPAYINTLIAE